MNGENLESSGGGRGGALGGLTRRVVPGSVVDSARSIPVLDSLALPSTYLELMSPPLNAMGFSTDEAERNRVEGGSRTTLRFTEVAGDAGRWPLLYIQDEILAVFTPGNKAFLLQVRELFEDEFTAFYVFHDQKPKGVYEIIAGEWESRHNFRTKFVSIEYMNELKELSRDEQVVFLRRVLELGTSPLKSTGAGRKDRTEFLRQLPRVITVLQNTPAFETARTRETFLTLAGLADIIPETVLQGARGAAAGEVVLSLIKRGMVGFGLLLRALVDIPELSQDDHKLVRGLLDQYAFD